MRNPFATIEARDARRLWLAGLGVNMMRWLELLAYGVLALQLTGSALWVAAMTIARLLPLLTGAVVTAAIAGHSRKTVVTTIIALLVVTDCVLLGLVVTGRLALWHMLLAAAMGGVAWTVETPVRRTMLADSVGLNRVSSAMGLEVVGVQLTRILGPALGGLLLDTGGIASVFAMGIVVHGLCTWMMLSQPPDRPATSPTNLAGIARNLAEGFAYVRRHRLLTGVVLLTMVFNFFGFPYVALAPVIGERVLHVGPTGIGLLLAADAVGALIAAFILTGRPRPDLSGRIFSLGAVLYLAATLAFGLASSIWVAFAVLFVGGFGMAGFNAMQISLPLQATPAAIQVRVLGIVTFAIGTAPFGFLHAGLLAEWLGAVHAQRLIAAEGLAAAALVLRLWPELLRREPPRPLGS